MWGNNLKNTPKITKKPFIQSCTDKGRRVMDIIKNFWSISADPLKVYWPDKFSLRAIEFHTVNSVNSIINNLIKYLEYFEFIVFEIILKRLTISVAILLEIWSWPKNSWYNDRQNYHLSICWYRSFQLDNKLKTNKRNFGTTDKLNDYLKINIWSF